MAKDQVSFNVPVALMQGLILCDPLWNARGDITAEGDEDGETANGFKELKSSIANQGLREPVIVRPVQGKYGKQYMVVDGHRRFEAVAQLHNAKMAVPGVSAGQVMVIVKNLTEEEARDWNIESCIQRDTIGGADLCFGIKQRVLLNERKWEGLNQTALGRQYGIGQTYFGKLCKIGAKVDDAVFAEWRKKFNHGIGITVDAMAKLADLPKQEQAEKYAELAKSKDKPKHEKGEGGPLKWIGSSRDKATQLGVNLGAAQKNGFLTVNKSKMFSVEGLRELGVTIKTEGKAAANERQVSSIVDACEKAYERALKAGRPKSEDTDDADTEVKGKGKGKAAHAN
jgi:hypothetical protein